MTSEVTRLQASILALSVDLTARIGDVKETLDRFREEVNERALREQVGKMHGLEFSTARVVEGLVGLAQMDLSPAGPRQEIWQCARCNAYNVMPDTTCFRCNRKRDPAGAGTRPSAPA